MADEPEISPGGSEILRHDTARDEELVPTGWAGQELIEDHVARHLGPIATVFHELVSPYVHLDVLIVEATEDRPFHWLVTSGMSSRPMPAEDDEPRYAELVIGLVADWPLDRESWQDERHYWPVRVLKQVARMPHEFGFALGPWHTVPNDDPPQPYGPGTELCCAMPAPPVTTSEEFDRLETPEGTVHFLGLFLLHRDEMELKLEQGSRALVEALDRAEVTEVVEPGRPSTAKKKRFGLF